MSETLPGSSRRIVDSTSLHQIVGGKYCFRTAMLLAKYNPINIQINNVLCGYQFIFYNLKFVIKL